MKVTFFSNFLNHHQLPFCKAMYEKLGNDFKFVATESIPKERLDMGYEDMSKLYPFSINTYDSNNSYETGLKLAYNSDVVIIGSAPDDFIKRRLKDNKLTFRYSERIFKTGRWKVLSPRVLINLLRHHTRYKGRNLYMLCASAYTASDFALVGAYKNKTYKWGYFPETKHYETFDFKYKKNKEEVKILWVGRFLEWKHPQKAIAVAKMLKEEGYKFTLNLIGSGSLFNKMQELINLYKLKECVNLLGVMPPDEVRNYMEQTDIYLFTSDYNEGWGAVLNEAMNSGCAVVASHAIGAVPYLINNGENGLIYINDSIKNLYSNVKLLIDDEKLRNKIGINAYYTIRDQWNADVAANRIMELSLSLLSSSNFEAESGPCSISNPISQEKMYSYIKNTSKHYNKMQ